MELKHNCIRDVMLYLESNQKLHDTVISTSIKIDGYTNDDIFYTVSKLTEAGYLDAEQHDLCSIIPIKGITYSGHMFLDNIRDDVVWKETTNKLSKFKSASIEIINQVAAGIILNMMGIK